MAAESTYRRLQQHLDQMPVGFPATDSGVELRLLEHLFTPEEAEMALHLSAFPESVEKIHARAKNDGVELAELESALQRLADKGAILGTRIDGKLVHATSTLRLAMCRQPAMPRATQRQDLDYRAFRALASATPSPLSG
jgi:hypothetical protein